MSVVQIRGGIPHVRRLTATTAGLVHHVQQATFHMKMRVTTAFPCRVYFNEDDYDNDDNYLYLPVAAAETPYGEWEGPVELYPGAKIWLKGIGGDSVVELTAFLRRG